MLNSRWLYSFCHSYRLFLLPPPSRCFQVMTDSWRVQVKLFVEKNVVCEAIVSSTAGAIAGMVVTSEVLF